MVKIPNATAIKRRNDSGMSAVSSYSTEGMTEPLDEGAKFINDLREKRLKSQTSKAEADMLIYMENQKTAFDHDDDYESIEERWNTGVTEKMGSIAGSIHDAEIREAFVEKYKPRIEAQRQVIRDLSWSKEKDKDRADVKDRVMTMQDAYARSGDPEYITGVRSLIDNSKGYYEEEKVSLNASNGIGMIKGRLNVIAADNPSKAVEYLNSDIGKNLPEGERAKLITQYQDKYVEYQAMGIVDDYMSRELSLSAGADEAEKIKDPMLRKAVEERFAYDKRMEKAAEVESQAAIHEDWHVRLGPKGDGATIDDIPQDQWELLTPAQRQNLKSLHYDKRTVSDFDTLRELYLRLNGAQINGDWSDFNEYLLENSSKLSYSDSKEFLKLTLEEQKKGIIPPELDTGMTDLQMIEGVMTENNLFSENDSKNKKIKSAIYHELGLWRIKKQKQNQGKEPDDEEVLKALDRFILNYDEHSFWGEDAPYYKLSEEEIKANLNKMREDNPERYQLILEKFVARKERPTNDQLLMLMRDDMTDADVVRWFNE